MITKVSFVVFYNESINTMQKLLIYSTQGYKEGETNFLKIVLMSKVAIAVITYEI
jgi:hypothetical protein